MSAQAELVYRFGPYEVRPGTRDLHKGSSRIKLRPQPFRVLELLVERSGGVVTREELQQLLWTSETFVDFEQGLNTAIKELRSALNDSASHARYIETVPKLGYRLLVPVERRNGATRPQADPGRDLPAAESGAAALAAMAPRSRPSASPGRHTWSIPALMAATLLVACVAAYFFWTRGHARTQPTSARTSIRVAVLPFQNLTGDSGQEYFSDGLTEEMITQLASVDPQAFAVVGRTSVMRYKDTHEAIDRIGQELGVQYVLEGSVRRDAETVRIAAQLIQVNNQTHLWAREYDRQLSNVLTLQGEIAQEIGDEIELTITGKPASTAAPRASGSKTRSYEAYDLYLRGLYFWNKRTADGFEQAATYFQQAIAKDSDYARAYAGLADTYALMSSWYVAPQAEVVPKARQAALRALQLDAGLAEAHASLALIAQNHDYDWQTSEEEYRRAIQLDPGYATAHQWYAEFLSLQGRFDEALAESERARQLDPLSLIIATDHAAILYFSRQYDRAIEQLRAILEMEPSFQRSRWLIVYSYVHTSRFADALKEVQEARRVNSSADDLGAEAFVYGCWGKKARALQGLERFQQAAKREHANPMPWTLFVNAATGRADQVIEILQKAYAEHSNAVVGMKVEPNYDPLRNDPRFRELLHQLGLDR